MTINRKTIIWKVTFSSVDGVVRTYQKKQQLFTEEETMCFRYISSYINSGKWYDTTEVQEPPIIQIGNQSFDALTRAAWYFHDFIDRSVYWEIAKLCENDESFAESIMCEAAKAAKNLTENGKKEWNNAKRRLKEHKKKGISLHSDYCYVVTYFKLYSILDFMFEE